MDVNKIEDLYELSPMQQGMLSHSLAAPEAGLYVIQLSYTLHGDLNLSAFEQAWQQVMARHLVLRTSFHREDVEKPLQVVHGQVTLPLEVLDWRELSAAAQPDRLEAFLVADRRRGFEFEQAPVMRLALIKLTENTHQLIWSFHHIVFDGWSASLLLQEVLAFYQAFCRGQSLQLEPPRSYRDYIIWLQHQDLSQAEAYWRQTLKGFTAPTPFGVDRAQKQTGLDQEGGYQALETKLSVDATSALQSLAREHHLTLNTVVQGAWALLLSRYSGEEDILFGSVISGRPAELAGAATRVGLFINTLPTRVRVSAEEKLLPWLNALQAQQVEMRQYEYSPVLKIQGWSDVPRGLPLFESVFIFENWPGDLSLQDWRGELEIGEARCMEGGTGFPLTVQVSPDRQLALIINYDRRRFDADTISRMLEHWRTLLEGMVANPQRRLSELPLVTEAERHQLLVAGNDTLADYPHDQCLHELFEAQTRRTPDDTALIFENQKMTYRELNARANQLAHHLRKLGVGPDVLVGICVERSLEMVVGLLGILKAGGAYVPLDPAYPEERLAFMLEDAQAPVLLTQQRLLEKLPIQNPKSKIQNLPVMCLDTGWEVVAGESEENPVSGTTPENLAYVMYTSGSTGIPKGVLGLHRGAINRFAWMWQTYPFERDEVCCQKTSLNFVDSVWELFGPLLQGIPTVIIPDESLKDTHRLIQTLATHRVSRLVLVPSLLRVILDGDGDLQRQLSALKMWVCSGETLPVELSQRFREKLPHSVLLNLYGSSEVAADVTWCNAGLMKEDMGSVPIGRPIANTQIYLLDQNWQPVPVGVTGEVYVGGDNLARGYHRRADLTAEKFIPNLFSERAGARLYKTGDLARYQPDGHIEFLGRRDYQVKIRGFRIELGEIEAVLSQHKGVRQTVVLAREDGESDKRLVAYLVADRQPAPPVSELRRFLQGKLPEYMVPSTFVMLDALPLLPNGKVDRRALPAPDGDRPELETALVVSRTDLEQFLVNMWRDILRMKKIGVYDDFFELGGDSIQWTLFVNRVQQALGEFVYMVALSATPTIAGVATYLMEQYPQSVAKMLEAAAVAEKAEAATVGSTPKAFAPRQFISRIKTRLFSRSKPKDEEQLLARVDQLSDEEVDALLRDMERGK
jgi:amino acid adenylation domain-containing protein